PKTQDRSLQGVEPGDVAKLRDGIAVDETMVAQQPNAGGDVIGIGGDEAGVAERIKNLERMSRETPDRAQRACTTIAIARSHRLRGILDDREPVPFRARAQGFHVADAAPEVYRHQCCCPRGHSCRHRFRIDQTVTSNVSEDRRGACAHNRGGRGDEGVRGGDDLVAWPDAGGDHSEYERIRAGVERYRMAGADVVGDLALECLDL